MPKADIRIIKPVRLNKGKQLPVKGKELIPELNASVAFLAKTNSGKSTVIYNLLAKTIDKRTTCLIFSSTVNVDEVYVKMIKMLKRKGIKVHSFTSIVDESGVNRLDAFVDAIQEIEEEGNEEKEEKETPKSAPLVNTIHPIIDLQIVEEKEDKVKVKRGKKKKKAVDRVPKYQIVLDDLSLSETRTGLYNLLKKSRHLCRIFVSGQSLLTLSPNAFNQLTYVYIWKGFGDNHLRNLFSRMSTDLTYDQFKNLYEQVTKPKYSFLNINLRTGEFRQNFFKI